MMYNRRTRCTFFLLFPCLSFAKQLEQHKPIEPVESIFHPEAWMPKCVSRLGWMALGAFITWFAITMLHFNEKTSLMEFSSHHIPTVKGRHSTVTVRPAGTSAGAASDDLRTGAATKEAAAEVKAAPAEPKVAAPEQRAAAPSSSKLKAKKEQVVNSMREIWRNYKAHAWGYDELKPRSQQGYPPAAEQSAVSAH